MSFFIRICIITALKESTTQRLLNVTFHSNDAYVLSFPGSLLKTFIFDDSYIKVLLSRGKHPFASLFCPLPACKQSPYYDLCIVHG